MGCNFLLGRVGFISFGQPAYLAVGAYASRVLSVLFRQQRLCRHSVGIAAGIVVSIAVGALFVRLRRDYFALVNLALGGDHLLSHAEGAGGHHPWRQRAVVSDQPRVHARAGFVQCRTSSSSSRSWSLSPSGRSTNISTIRSSAPAAWRAKINEDKLHIPRLQQLPHPAWPPSSSPIRPPRWPGRCMPSTSASSVPEIDQPVAGRGAGGGDDPGRRRHAVRADRRLARLHRHEGPDQQDPRQLGADHRLRCWS